MLPARTAVLVNTDFLARPDAPGYACDAAVLDTARAIAEVLRSLHVDVAQIEVAESLDGLPAQLRGYETVFNLVESIDGDYGREWEVPELLDRIGVRYTGNGLRTLQLCQEKDRARTLLIEAGVRVAPGVVVQDELPEVGYPCFVKPARVDGSIGIDAGSRCVDRAALAARLAKLRAELPGPYLVEAYLPGKEINVALFPEPARGHVVPTEIDFSPLPPELPRFVTYDSKWNPESPEYVTKSVPAVLDAALRREVEQLAREAFLALAGSSYGRVDMRLDAEGRPCVIDVNPNNDLHPEAGLAVAARSVGVDYAALIGGILARAHERDR
ncbi:MAG TPA: D-alanine--D-alanine ligase [Polyangiales bacterium]|nr:D-alanine--D-alanine ligase [Polyangiales bacterium]